MSPATLAAVVLPGGAAGPGTVSAVASFRVRVIVCLVTTSNIGTTVALESLQSKQTRQTAVGRRNRGMRPLSQGHHGAARSVTV